MEWDLGTGLAVSVEEALPVNTCIHICTPSHTRGITPAFIPDGQLDVTLTSLESLTSLPEDQGMLLQKACDFFPLLRSSALKASLSAKNRRNFSAWVTVSSRESQKKCVPE